MFCKGCITGEELHCGFTIIVVGCIVVSMSLCEAFLLDAYLEVVLWLFSSELAQGYLVFVFVPYIRCSLSYLPGASHGEITHLYFVYHL